MANNIPSYYVSQFATNIQLLLQQKGSRLRGSVSQGSYVGKQASPVEQVGAVTATKVTNRFAPMGRVDAPADRRWVFPVDYDLPQLIDSFDKLRLIIDPASAYVQNAVAAMGRAIDDEIIAGALGTNMTGTNATTSTSFAAGQVVSVQQGAASPTGLTVAKLREAKRILMTNEVDLDNDPLYCVVKAKQLDNLLAEVQVISSDFNEHPVLTEGRITRFLGINFIHTERVTNGTDDQAGTSDQVIMYAKSGLHLGLWNDISTDISQRKDLQGIPYQAYVYGTFGATRLEEKKITKIWCR